MIKRLEALQKFLKAVSRLAKNKDITIEEAYKFAKQEFGEVSDLLKLQINKIFKTSDAPSIKKPKSKNNVFTLIPKDKLRPAKMEETPSQASGLESLKNPFRPGGGLDQVTGITRALARRILDRKGIEIGKKDPIDAFTDTFGEAITDVKNLAEEMIEIDARGGGMKDMDQMLEIEGLFDIPVPKSPSKGLTDKEMLDLMEEAEQEDILKKFDPEDREPNSKGGINRVGFDEGSPKNKKGIMKVIKKIPKVGKVAGGLEAAYNTLSKKFGSDVLKTADEIERPESAKIKQAMEDFELRNPDPKRQLTDDEIDDLAGEVGELDAYDFDGTVESANRIRKQYKDYIDDMYQQYKMGKLDPEPGDKSEARMILLRRRAEEMEATGDTRLMTPDEMDELSELEARYLKDVDEAYGVDTKLRKELNEMKKLGADKTAERFELKQKYPGLDDDLLTAIIDDPDPNNKAQVLATLEQLEQLRKLGKTPEEAVDIISKTMFRGRKDNAEGGLNYLMGM